MQQIKTQALAPAVQAFMDRNYPDGWSKKRLLESFPILSVGDDRVDITYDDCEYTALTYSDLATETVLIMSRTRQSSDQSTY